VRVIAGIAKGHPLAAPRGLDVRPTSDKVRGAIFNILHASADGPELEGARVLDLFAGTGALGIEALSRGAKHATFVEKDRKTADTITANLASTKLAAQATVIVRDADALPKPVLDGPYEIVFVDPPYALVPSSRVIRALAGMLAPGGVAVVEHAVDAPPPVPEGLVAADVRRYGSTAVTFFRPEGSHA